MTKHILNDIISTLHVCRPLQTDDKWMLQREELIRGFFQHVTTFIVHLKHHHNHAPGRSLDYILQKTMNISIKQ